MNLRFQQQIQTDTRQHSRMWLFFVLLASVVTGFSIFIGGSSPLRVAIVFSYMLLIPGWSFVRLLPVSSAIIQWTLAVTLSLVLNTLIAMFLLFIIAWSVHTGVLMLIAISILGSLIRTNEAGIGDTTQRSSAHLELTQPSRNHPFTGRR
jgi:hypothetical protein